MAAFNENETKISEQRLYELKWLYHEVCKRYKEAHTRAKRSQTYNYIFLDASGQLQAMERVFMILGINGALFEPEFHEWFKNI